MVDEEGGKLLGQVFLRLTGPQAQAAMTERNSHSDLR